MTQLQRDKLRFDLEGFLCLREVSSHAHLYDVFLAEIIQNSGGMAGAW